MLKPFLDKFTSQKFVLENINPFIYIKKCSHLPQQWNNKKNEIFALIAKLNLKAILN